MKTNARPTIKVLIWVCFFAYLVVGLTISGDYGTGIDEINNIKFGNQWGKYIDDVAATGRLPVINDHIIRNTDPTKADRFIVLHNLCHGPFWEVTLYYSEKLFLPSSPDMRDILLLRHRMNFLLFFTASCIFYRTCVHMFQSCIPALLGTSLLILHPRIFAHSFYNTVDVPFLAFYGISFYTLLLFVERKTLRAALWHALACAMLVDIRAAGLLMPLLTGGVFAFEFCLRTAAGQRLRWINVFTLYGSCFLLLMILFWPFLWRDTLPHFLDSVRGGMLQTGLPASPFYNLRWIAVTTPPVYLLLFIIGVAVVVVSLFMRREDYPVGCKGLVIALLCFAIPIVAAAVSQSTLYNDWRHHYFVYPPFVILCVFGSQALMRWAGNIRLLALRRFAILVAGLFPLVGLGGAAIFIMEQHPFQFAYGNIMSTVKCRLIPTDVVIDYWRVSYRHLLEELALTDTRGHISVATSQGYPDGVKLNISILPNGLRERFSWEPDARKADYVISNYRLPKGDIPAEPSAAAIYVEGIPLEGVYPVKH